MKQNSKHFITIISFIVAGSALSRGKIIAIDNIVSHLATKHLVFSWN